MQYFDFKGEKLSSLGMGCMRLPQKEDGTIDIKSTEKMVEYAMSHGINYYDTAYGYHSGQSEIVIGNILNQYDRKSYYIATKFPGYDLKNLTSKKLVEEIFQKQLEKTKKDYFDFYLFHNVNERNVNLFMDEEIGVYEYLMEMKSKGYIKHLGFSCHGRLDTLDLFYQKYASDLEFCQIQLNYLDAKLQKAKEKVEYLNKHNTPVWVMEPVRGGKLANLEPQYEERLRSLRPDESVVAWAFRYLQSLNGIGVTLSGMSNLEQLKANIRTFDDFIPLDEKEMKTLQNTVDEMLEGHILPCVECRYCMEKCPMQLDIPKLLSLYSEYKYSDGFLTPLVVSSLEENKRPDACLHCRSCEGVCPQKIKISDAMSDFCKLLEERRKNK